MARTKLAPQKRKAFLEQLALNAHVSNAAEFIGVGRSLLYHWKAADPKFSKEWDAAVELGLNACEDEVVRRGVHGYDEPVFYKGEQCGAIRRFSDNLLMFKLKAERPKYRDKSIADSIDNLAEKIDAARAREGKLKGKDLKK